MSLKRYIPQLNYNEKVPVSEVPTTGIVTAPGAVFNGYWYGTATSNIVVDVVNKAVTSDKKCYPGIQMPMTDIEGKWVGTDSKGAWTVEINAANNTVTAILGEETLTVNWFRFQTLDGATKLVINYTKEGSSATSLALTYDSDAATFKSGTTSSALVLTKLSGITVTFNADNGEANTFVSVMPGETVAKPADPTKDGYSFEGWINFVQQFLYQLLFGRNC